MGQCNLVPESSPGGAAEQLCLTLCNPMDCNHPPPPAPLSMGFPRHEYWSGLPFLPPGDLPVIEPMSPAIVGGFFTSLLGLGFPICKMGIIIAPIT